ncbi:hypothetical protein DFH07DRAFT_960144 [Mycena maculata]|uniref:Uncharacterized protein n=1 Tax=Mycena maculata TaxID=230809 RepID=A0AAD7IZG9_9AGAR|nr:hypothetical protein DFH07DRAFT_960144 [Mycena maculata]
MKRHLERKVEPGKSKPRLQEMENGTVIPFLSPRLCVASCTAYLEEMSSSENQRIQGVDSAWRKFRFSVGAPDAEAKFQKALKSETETNSNATKYLRLYVSAFVLEIRFPPFFRIITPRFLPFMHGGGGHVTGGARLHLHGLPHVRRLAPSHRIISAVLMQIELAISNLDPKPARLAPNWNTPYAIGEASSTYGWTALLRSVQKVRQNKDDCVILMEHIHQVLFGIIAVHVNSEIGGEFSPSMLDHSGKFTETLHKVYNLIESQEEKSKIIQFFRQGEMSMLLKGCHAGLQQALQVFKVGAPGQFTDLRELQKHAEEKHQEVLNLIESLSDGITSDGASSLNKLSQWSRQNRSQCEEQNGQPKYSGLGHS